MPTLETSYRLALAEGFLGEARQDLGLKRWRSCVDNSQLAVENAAKAVLSLLGPVGRTHNAAALLRRELAANRFPGEIITTVERLAECAELLGPDIHVHSDYGDEAGGKTPWQIFDESDARKALSMAEESVHLVEHAIRAGS